MTPPLPPLIQTKKKLSDLSTFGIGGPAEYFAEVSSEQEMADVLVFAKKNQLRHMVLGKGSNCLFDDQGYSGLIILNKITFLEGLDSGQVKAGSGYSFSLLGSQTARKGLSGLEFASGIPGSVGGAVVMNAGANGKETCEALKSVDFMNMEGMITTFQRDKLSYGYRSSPFQKMKGAVTAAEFTLIKSLKARQKQIEIIDYRKKTQPLKEKSAGCVFRNPDNGHSGALIEQCGLKGKKIGGAMVSEQHANFIVNTGGATASDALKLIRLIQEQVRLQTGRQLKMEVRYIPYE
jgi:UDP-N-acetylmuramate dehydrogenase